MLRLRLLSQRRSYAHAALLAATSLGGCTSGPDFIRPAVPATSGYVADQSTTVAVPDSGEGNQVIKSGAPLRTDWWTALGSPALNETVRQALADNRTLASAEANVARATQEVAAARGSLAPQVDATGSVGHQKYGASFLGPLAFTFPQFSPYSGGAQVSYDLDLFGGNHRRVEEASAEAETERYRLDAARLNVAGGVVLEALQIAATRARVEVLEQVIASDEKTLNLVTTARSVGVATGIDVTTAQTQLDRDRSLLPPLRQEIDVAESALAVLVGRAPADWRTPAFRLSDFTLPAEIPLAIPSDLVRGRPDILAAEADLHAANAAVGVATSDLYPHLTLSAALAGQGLFTGGFGSAWNIIGGLTAPIFHGGTLTARKRSAVAARDAAFAQYQQTVLEAFRQVADALHGLANASDTIAAQRRALASAGEALELTRHGFADGNIGIVQVLDAQRLQQLAEDDLVQARAQRLVQTVTIFVAAGGGFGNADTLTGGGA